MIAADLNQSKHNKSHNTNQQQETKPNRNKANAPEKSKNKQHQIAQSLQIEPVLATHLRQATTITSIVSNLTEQQKHQFQPDYAYFECKHNDFSMQK